MSNIYNLFKRLFGISKIKNNTVPKCKYCGGIDFYAGPECGCSVNILCANNKCRHWFNYLPGSADSMEDLNKIEPITNYKL